MPEFMVDDDLAEAVWALAKPRPFENLSFSSALRRILLHGTKKGSSDNATTVESLSTHSVTRGATGKKALSPNAGAWAQKVPELKTRHNLGTWQAICEFLKIDTAGDSARRKLRNWVKANRPNWPEVPSIESDA